MGTSVCVCGALTLPIAGTVLVLMAALGLFLVPSLLLLLPPLLPWLGDCPWVTVPLGSVEPRPAGPPSRRCGLVRCSSVPAGDRARPLQRGASPNPAGPRAAGPRGLRGLGRVGGRAAPAAARSSAEERGRLGGSWFLPGRFSVSGTGDRGLCTLCRRGRRPGWSPARTSLCSPRRAGGWFAGCLGPTGPSLGSSRSQHLFPRRACNRITRNRTALLPIAESRTRERPDDEQFLMTNYYLYM